MTNRNAAANATLVSVIAGFLADLDPSDRAALLEEHAPSGQVDARYDQQLLADAATGSVAR